MKLYVDTETNGFVEHLDRIHSIVIRNADTGDLMMSCADQAGYEPLEMALEIMQAADELVGHNLIGFDIPALQKVFPNWKTKAKLVDTLDLSRVAYPAERLREMDFTLQKKGKLPANLIGRHSIEAWGYRLGEKKEGTDITDWSTWTPYMHARCESDTLVGVKLWWHLRDQGVPDEVVELERRVAQIIRRQEAHGFLFDAKAADELAAKLMRRKAELEAELQNAFPPWEVRTPFTPKANNKKMGYVKGVPTEKVRTVVFNPASRDHIANRLIEVRGWKPKEFTSTGKPQVDEGTIGTLPYPEAKTIGEYLMVGKRLGQLAEGKEALMAHVRKDGRIHGSVNPNGANTYRMTHSRPNMAQVPSVRAPYGKDFRALLGVPAGYRLVGCDADALELRCLASYMAPFDGGAYTKTVLEGKKEDGTDIHSVNAKALGLDPVRKYPVDGKSLTGRDIAKVWFYAFIYGAGDFKLGTILGVKGSDGKVRNAGKASRARFLKSLPALNTLVTKVKQRAKLRGFLLAIDGRKLFVRSEHAALNTLLQSAGAIVMKKALVMLDDFLREAGMRSGIDYEFVANVHDEWQIEVREPLAESVGRAARTSIVAAGEALRFRCPLDGGYVVGKNWAETH